MVTGQTANEINILKITLPSQSTVAITYTAAAVMTIPRLVTDITGITGDQYDIIVNLNLWAFAGDLATPELDTASVLDSTATEVTQLVTDSSMSTGFHVTNSGIGSSGVYLISASLKGSGLINVS